MSLAVQQTKEMTSFNPEQKSLIKNYLCKGITDDELSLFSAVCRKTGLDPFMKQIYAVKRKDVMTIQTSIDGYRLIAERTGRYAPGRESTFTYDQHGQLFSATSYVKKQTQDGTWHEIGATAFFEEYKPSYSNQFWESKKHIMLAKCAESLALRKAFPSELSGLYSEEEMHQAEKPKEVSPSEVEELETLISQCPDETRKTIEDYIKGQLKIESLCDLPRKQYELLKKRAQKILNQPKLEEANEYANAGT